ncbi:Hypothetical protein, putative [Bodo saltans]|uniref:Uncharacterized protein n=1 Tax=Bodo saltans TaxID=75058 RepID=A0A0S4IVK2_BODSA|nr:Hypothetical protein, putative [Bodo saltans]|eukprot:CUF88911.1 Hypothetical protein, putative [Bodo saltans]
MWGRRLPPSLPQVRIESLGRGQGIAIALEVTPVVAIDGVEPFKIANVFVNVGVCFMMLLNPQVFDEMVALRCVFSFLFFHDVSTLQKTDRV